VDGGAGTSLDLLQRLENSLRDFTPAERAIANFILNNRGGIAFESADSIAEKLDVSSVTVGRFSRKMGYRHFKDLKAGLRTTMSGAPWLVGDQATRFMDGQGEGHFPKRSLELEIAAIVEVYGMAETETWKEIVGLLAHSPQVHVAGFQTERAVAAALAYQLQYTRDGVSLVDGAAGNFHEIFAGDPAGRCLVLVDLRRYSEQAHDLAAQASADGIPVIMLTDKFCDWIRKFTNLIIPVSTEVELFWSSQVSLGCAVNLLVNGVIGELGAGVEARLERVTRLYQNYTGHVGGSTVRRRAKS
jgi:DNA-binding MurR/RpiR family transcriptional regulator